MVQNKFSSLSKSFTLTERTVSLTTTAHKEVVDYSRIVDAERGIAFSVFETAIVFDSKGEEIFRVIGDHKNVPFTPINKGS